MAGEYEHYDALRKRLQRCLGMAQPLRQSLIRAASTTYARRGDLLTGMGSSIAGARWNPRGIRVVYLAFSVRTALAEYFGNSVELFALPPAALLSETTVQVDVFLDKVLDLTDGAVRNCLKISHQTMVTTPWSRIQEEGSEPVTQFLGRTARDLGLGGLIVPSAADPAGRCLACFCDKVGKGSLQIRNEDRIPP